MHDPSSGDSPVIRTASAASLPSVLSPERYDLQSSSSLLTNYKITTLVRPPPLDRPEPIVTEGRNFAVAMLQHLAGRTDALRSLKERFDGLVGDRPWLSSAQWVELLKEALAKASSLERGGDGVRPPSRLEASGEESPAARVAAGGGPRADDRFWAIVNDTSEKGVALCDELLLRVVAMFDASGRQRSTWEDFSAFLADCALRGSVLPDLPDIHRYHTQPPIKRETRLPLTDVRWLPAVNRLAALCHVGRGQVSNPETRIDLIAPESTGGGATGQWRSSATTHTVPFMITAMDVVPHLPGGPHAVVSCGDLNLRVIELKGSRPHTVYAQDVHDNYSILHWANRWERLWCGGSDGSVAVWTVPRTPAPSTPMELLLTDRTHQSTVVHLAVMPHDGAVLSASMDPRLVLQDPAYHHVVADFAGHTGGVLSVAHCPEYGLLGSCGFESDVFLWTTQGRRRTTRSQPSSPVHGTHHTPTGSSTIRPIARLRDVDTPHRPHIVSVEAVPGTPQLLSVDVTGMLKVWDLRTFSCVQSIRTDPRNAAAHAAGTAPQLLELVNHATAGSGAQAVAGPGVYSGAAYIPSARALVAHTHLHLRPVVYTDRGRRFNKTTADDTIVSVCHSPSADCLVSATQRCLQTWEVRTGVLSAEYRLPSDSLGEVTAFGIDGNGRRVLTGHRGGTVAFHGATNGVLLARCNPSEADVVDVCGYGTDGIGVSTDDAGTVHIFSDQSETMPLTRLEMGCAAKFCRVSAAGRTIFVFHASLKVHVFVMKARRHTPPTLVQIIDLATNVAELVLDARTATERLRAGRLSLPRVPGVGSSTAAVGSKAERSHLIHSSSASGDVLAACFLHPGDEPSRTGSGGYPVSFAGIDSTNTVCLWSALRFGEAGITEFACTGRWAVDFMRGVDVSCMAYEPVYQLLYLGASAGTIAVYSVRDAMSAAVTEAEGRREMLAASLNGWQPGLSSRVALPAVSVATLEDTSIRPTAIVPQAAAGVTVVAPGDRTLLVHPLTVSGAQQLGTLSLETSAVHLPDGLASFQDLRDQEERRLRAALYKASQSLSNRSHLGGATVEDDRASDGDAAAASPAASQTQLLRRTPALPWVRRHPSAPEPSPESDVEEDEEDDIGDDAGGFCFNVTAHSGDRSEGSVGRRSLRSGSIGGLGAQNTFLTDGGTVRSRSGSLAMTRTFNGTTASFDPELDATMAPHVVRRKPDRPPRVPLNPGPAGRGATAPTLPHRKPAPKARERYDEEFRADPRNTGLLPAHLHQRMSRRELREYRRRRHAAEVEAEKHRAALPPQGTAPLSAYIERQRQAPAQPCASSSPGSRRDSGGTASPEVVRRSYVTVRAPPRALSTPPTLLARGPGSSSTLFPPVGTTAPATPPERPQRTDDAAVSPTSVPSPSSRLMMSMEQVHAMLDPPAVLPYTEEPRDAPSYAVATLIRRHRHAPGPQVERDCGDVFTAVPVALSPPPPPVLPSVQDDAHQSDTPAPGSPLNSSLPRSPQSAVTSSMDATPLLRRRPPTVEGSTWSPTGAAGLAQTLPLGDGTSTGAGVRARAALSTPLPVVRYRGEATTIGTLPRMSMTRRYGAPTAALSQQQQQRRAASTRPVARELGIFL